jgi:hypothetical protein
MGVFVALAASLDFIPRRHGTTIGGVDEGDRAATRLAMLTRVICDSFPRGTDQQFATVRRWPAARLDGFDAVGDHVGPGLMQADGFEDHAMISKGMSGPDWRGAGTSAGFRLAALTGGSDGPLDDSRGTERHTSHTAQLGRV